MKQYLLLASAFFLVAGCSDDNPVTPSGSITLTTSRPNPTITSGGTAAVPIKVSRSGGFTGNVSLSVEDVPTGLTTTLVSEVIASGDTMTFLKLRAANIADPEEIPITVTATAVGVAPSSTVINLTVTANGVNITVGDTEVSVTQGGTVSVPITITRTGTFTGAISLTAEGLPPGMTATISPNPIAAGSQTATMTITASSSATIGNRTVFITATGTGITEATEVVSVTTTPSG